WGVCFVQGEDGIRDWSVTGVQTCALPIYVAIAPLWKGQRFPMSACISGWSMLNRCPAVISDIYADSRIPHDAYRPTFVKSLVMEIGRASCREREQASVGARRLEECRGRRS